MTKNLSRIRSEALIGRRSSYIVLAIVYEWHSKGHEGQMKTRWISNKTVKTGRIYSSLEEAFEFCWSSFADEHNTLVKSTRRKVKLNKFGCGTSWLPDILIFKHWFTSSVWNFCRWVANVPPRETSPAAKSEAKQLFSQATTHLLPVRSKYLFTLTYLICDDPVSR